MGNNAIILGDGIELPKVNGLPRVTANILTPYILCDLEDYVEVYLEDKNIADKKKRLKKLAGCFANSEHMKWTMTEAAKQPIGTTLTMFMDKLHRRFLPDNWELEIHNDQEADTMKKNDNFVDWVTRVKKKNAVLVNTGFHLDDEHLRSFLQAHLYHELMQLVFDTTTPSGVKLYALTDLAKWEHEVQRLDNFRRRQQKVIREALQEANHRRNGKTGVPSRSRQPERKLESSSSGDSDRCLPLTDSERSVLKEYNGCFKCRKVLQTHVSRDCTAPWPRRDGYRTVQRPSQSEIDAFDKKKDNGLDKRGRAGTGAALSSDTRPAKRQKKEATASIVPAAQSEGDSSDDSDAIAFLREEGDTTMSE
jgi:hypothetical protein